MKSTWMVKNLMVIAALGFTSSLALAEAGYTDAITARTQKNTGTQGRWFELSASDWLFYEGEASAQYNLGAISQGTKVEVLRMNKQMARIRLPDGRVVFIRNRLLKETAAPSSTERQTLAARTGAIGKNKLHGGNPHVAPKAADFASANIVPPRPIARPTVVPPTASSGVVANRPNPGSSAGGTGVAASTGPATSTAAIPLPLPGQTAVTGVTAPSAPVRNDAVAAPSGVVASSGAVAATGAVAPSGAVAASGSVAASGAANADNDGGKCDPKKQWQSPVRQAFRITDCLGSARDGGGRRHAGIDIAGARAGMVGIPIFPTATGRISRSGHNGGYGCFVEISHDECPSSVVKWRRGLGCVTRYAHLATKTVKNRKGKSVRVCDVPEAGKVVTPCTRIGGMSGTGANGRADDYASHLHFELRDFSTSIAFNPDTMLAGIRGSRQFQAAGSATCRASSKIDAANVQNLNWGVMEEVTGVREAGRQ